MLVDISDEVFEPFRDDRECDVQVDTHHQHVLRTAVEENNCAIPIPQMCHLLHLGGTRGVDGGLGVREVEGEDIKAPRARKPVSGVIWLLEKTRDLR